MQDLGLRGVRGSSEVNSRAGGRRLSWTREVLWSAQTKMVPREAPSSTHLLQETRLTSSVILEGKVRKSRFCTLIPGLEPLPVVPGPARRAPRCQSRVTWSGTPFPSPIHPQLTHLPRPCLSLLWEHTTNTLSATTSSSRSRAPAPARPPTSAFQEMATSQRGPKNQCVSVEKQLEDGVTGQHHLTTSRARTISAPRQPRSWQVGGAPPGDEGAVPEGPDDWPSWLWAGPHRQEGPLLCRTHWP